MKMVCSSGLESSISLVPVTDWLTVSWLVVWLTGPEASHWHLTGPSYRDLININSNWCCRILTGKMASPVATGLSLNPVTVF